MLLSQLPLFSTAGLFPEAKPFSHRVHILLPQFLLFNLFCFVPLNNSHEASLVGKGKPQAWPWL